MRTLTRIAQSGLLLALFSTGGLASAQAPTTPTPGGAGGSPAPGVAPNQPPAPGSVPGGSPGAALPPSGKAPAPAGQAGAAPGTSPAAGTAPGASPGAGAPPSGNVPLPAGQTQGTATTPPNAGESRPASADQVPIDPRGLTADSVGARARATSFSVQAQSESLRSAAARVDQAWAAYLPRLTVKASYTRLSDFTPPSLGSTDVKFLATVDNGKTTFPVPLAFNIPLALNQTLFTAGIVVPISDYFLRIGESYTATIHAEDAARYDLAAAGATAEANGRVAFYSWVRAKGAVNVAERALADQKTHLQDAKNQFTVGNASKADVLRAETGVASAELLLERSRNLETLTARQVKVAIHADDETPIATAEDVMTRSAPLTLTLAQATQTAQTSRAELRSLAANAEALKRQAKAARAAYYPTIAAFADANEGNPNPRRFGVTDEWFPTWDVGAQLIWSPNDALVNRSSTADADAKVAAIESQRQASIDGILIEVQQAWTAVKEADYAIDTTARQVASAEEAYRVARELFNAGRATSTTLTDAETDLVRARLEVLNANVDAKTARVRLDHAIGRDVKLPQSPSH